MRRTFDGCELFGWKDPRTCLTLPLWKQIFGRLGIPLHFVLIFRNPLDVARSLARRDGIDLRNALGLWFHNNLHLLLETGGEPRTAVRYEDLLAHRDREVGRLANALGLSGAASPESSKRIVDPSLCHSRSASEEVAAQAPALVADLHAAIEAAFDGGLPWGELVATAGSFMQDLKRFADVLTHDAWEARREVVRLRERLEGRSWSQLEPWFTKSV